MRTIRFYYFIILVIAVAACSQPERENKTKNSTLLEPVMVDKFNSAIESEDRRPNILLIVVDDMGYNDLSINGSEINTPNIDSLMEQGMIPDNFHVGVLR